MEQVGTRTRRKRDEKQQATTVSNCGIERKMDQDKNNRVESKTSTTTARSATDLGMPFCLLCCSSTLLYTKDKTMEKEDDDDRKERL